MAITSNGKPVAVRSGVEGDHLQEYLRPLRRARATMAVNIGYSDYRVDPDENPASSKKMDQC